MNNEKRARGGKTRIQVIDNLLEYIVTIENLQPLTDEIAAKLSERSKDAHTRIAAVQSKLDEVRRSMNNLLDAIEKMGYAPHIQDRYDERKREESELLAEMVSLEALTVKPRQIKFVTNDILKQWVEHTRETLESGDRGLARRAIQQFVAKVVIKNGTGMMYYTFPLEGELYMPSVQKVDLRGHHPFTRHLHRFKIPLPLSTEADLRHPDKEKLRDTILTLRAQGMSYREIGRMVGLHFTRIGQILKHITRTE